MPTDDGSTGSWERGVTMATPYAGPPTARPGAGTRRGTGSPDAESCAARRAGMMRASPRIGRDASEPRTDRRPGVLPGDDPEVLVERGAAHRSARPLRGPR